MKRYKKVLKEEVGNERVADIITSLRDESFGNGETRQRLIDLMTSLLTIKDADARKVFKKIGTALTSIGDDMLGTGKQVDGVMGDNPDLDDSVASSMAQIEDQLNGEYL